MIMMNLYFALYLMQSKKSKFYANFAQTSVLLKLAELYVVSGC